MSGKKRKKYNRSGSTVRGRSTAPVTVRDKKKALIRERIHADTDKSKGMRAMGVIVASIMLSRAALFIYELVYFASVGAKVGVVSNLLLFPLLFIIYMAHDGNRGLLGVTAVSAAVRIVYLFASMYPRLGGAVGAYAFVGVYLAVMAAQFIMSVLALSMPKVGAYCEEMRGINYELRAALLGRR